MTLELLLALVAFAFTMSITPGPNNLMLMASGANFGFLPTIPHMLGISIGHALMVVLLGLGMVGLFDAYPVLDTVLKVVSVVYLLWLAWKIATAAPVTEAGAKGSPMTFLQAAAFQWVNPKAWAMALGAITLYAPGHDFRGVAIVAFVFALTNLPSIGVWTVLGQGLAHILKTPSHLRTFNVVMALLLVGSLWPVLAGR
ncbi:MAG: LysE family translocator [Pseudomonadota bacterium]